jgi:hypothetical protein
MLCYVSSIASTAADALRNEEGVKQQAGVS